MNNLRNLRKEKKLSLNKLSQELNIGLSTLSQYETNKREPDHETLKKIADYFGVSIDYILGRTDCRKTFTQEEYYNIIRLADKLGLTVDELLGGKIDDTATVEKIYSVKDKVRERAERTLADFLKYSNYIMKHFKNPLIDDIKPLQIESVLKVYADRPGLCRHLRDAFSVMFAYAFKKGIISENTFLRVEMPALPTKRVLPCKEEDYNRLLKIIKAECPIYYPAILLGGVCGLRPGESLALTEDNVTPQYVKVCASVSYLSAKENELLGNDLQNSETVKAPKSHAGNRIIPITPEFYEELHYTKNLYKIKSEWICCNILGDRLDYLATGRQVRRTLKRHGIENFSLYQMRHFFGNANKRNGVDRFTTATLMGHADASVTERYYYAEDKILSQKATNKIIDSFFDFQNKLQ